MKKKLEGIILALLNLVFMHEKLKQTHTERHIYTLQNDDNVSLYIKQVSWIEYLTKEKDLPLETLQEFSQMG